MIKNLIFDFGKVLVDYDFEAFFSKIINDEKRVKEFSSIMNCPEVMQAMDRGAIPVEKIISDLKEKYPSFEKEIDCFDKRYTEIVTEEIVGMREILTSLKQKGYKLYGLSNWCNKVYLTINQFPIFKLLDGYVISSEYKIIKPESEIYQCLFDKFNLKPEECFFADDREENIIGSKKMGMNGVVFTDAQNYKEALKNICGIIL